MSKQVWKGIGLPSYNGDEYDFEHKYTVIVRLFERIQKYHRRGVKITNAPDGALDWPIADLAPDGMCNGRCRLKLPLRLHLRSFPRHNATTFTGL